MHGHTATTFKSKKSQERKRLQLMEKNSTLIGIPLCISNERQKLQQDTNSIIQLSAKICSAARNHNSNIGKLSDATASIAQSTTNAIDDMCLMLSFLAENQKKLSHRISALEKDMNNTQQAKRTKQDHSSTSFELFLPPTPEVTESETKKNPVSPSFVPTLPRNPGSSKVPLPDVQDSVANATEDDIQVERPFFQLSEVTVASPPPLYSPRTPDPVSPPFELPFPDPAVEALANENTQPWDFPDLNGTPDYNVDDVLPRPMFQ